MYGASRVSESPYMKKNKLSWLRISRSVTRNKNNISITLWVENQAWNVGVVNYGDKILFKKGCSKFLKDNSLLFNSFIPITCLSKSHFLTR